MTYDDITLFHNPDIKSETITVRLSTRQKARIVELAKQKALPVSQYLLSLVKEDLERNLGTHINLGVMEI